MYIKPPKTLFRLALISAAVAYAPFGSAAIEEVIVTANKRAQSINDVGLSISALSADKLTEQKLTSLEEISSAVPGLVYSASTANTPIFTLRGIGFNEQTLGAYPATSLYLDEAPMPFPVLAAHASYDLERVEVLKGPQGILFGQNSTGGAINFISAKPGTEFEAGGDFSYGSFDKAEVNGFVSGPVTDTFGARLAITAVNADEWQKSISRPGDENGAEEYFAARLTTVFEPSDTATYMASFNMWSDESDPQAQQLVAINPQVIPTDAVGAANLAAVVALPLAAEDNRLADWSTDIDPSGDRDFYQVILRADIDLSDGITLTALTTYQDFEQTQNTDGDGSALVLFDLAPVVGEIDTWITEIRLAGESDTLSWVAGVNYEESNTLEEETLHYKDSTNYNAANAFINTSGISLKQEISNYAMFANVDFNMSDALTLKLGARYTDSSNDVESCNSATANDAGTINAGQGANVATLFNVLGSLFSGNGTDFANPTSGSLPFTIIGEGGCYTLNASVLPGDVYTDSLEEDNVSWRAGIDFDISDNTLIYANISKGYKAGSYPALAAANFFQLDPVTQESVFAYEAGFKSSLADNSIQLNGAAFFYKYDDKQLRTKTVDPIFGLLDVLDNVPETEIFGVEADITAEVTENLTLSAAVTYLNSEVIEYKNGVGFNGVSGLDFSGEAIPFTPELTYSIGADYRISMDSGSVLFAGINVTGQSESEAAFGASKLRITAAQVANGAKQTVEDYNVMDSYSIINARVGFESADEKWKVMLWGKNIADEYYVTNVVASSDSSARFVGRPASYGVTVGFNY